MNKKIIIISALVFVMVIIPLIIFIIKPGKTIFSPNFNVPTPTPVENFKQETSLTVSSTIPENNGTNFPADGSIGVKFNKDITGKKINISVDPSIEYKLVYSGKDLFITPVNNLVKGAVYRITVNMNDLTSPYIFSFTTAIQETGSHDLAPTVFQGQDEEIRKTRPDVFLSNNVPYSSQTFSITSSVDNSTGFFNFTVILIGGNDTKSKQDTISWMKSFSLTDQEIAKINISYQSQAVASFKKILPYYGVNFAILYDKSTDKTTVTLFNDVTVGENNFNNFLKENGIADKSLINNLSIVRR